MARASKSYLQLITENKSHKTKKELEQRKKSEEKLLTNVKLKEDKMVKNNPISHKEFKRISTLLDTIDKNDDLLSGPINRYCILKAECAQLVERSETLYKNIQDLQQAWNSKESALTPSNYFELKAKLQAQYNASLKGLRPKRKMMFDIEKENLMTIAGALRIIPMSPEKEDDDDDLY